MMENETEALWQKVKNTREAQIKQLQDALIVEKEILKLATDKLKDEQTRIKWKEGLEKGKSLKETERREK